MTHTRLLRLAALSLAAALLLCGCKGDPAPAPEDTNADLYPYSDPVPHEVSTAYPDEDYGFQLEPPEAGEEIAVLYTNFGKVAVRLFPEGAPKTVANFKALIADGFYDGLSFHRVIDGFMIQTGDPAGDGTGGETADGKILPDEFDSKLLNLRGALAMGNLGIENTADSQFFINQKTENDYSPASCEEAAVSYKENYSDACANYKEYYEQNEENLTPYFEDWWEFFRANYYFAPIPDAVPEEVWDLYNTHGGNIHLDGAWRNYGGHTVFGQVFDGMEVVDAIAAIETDDNDAPLYLVVVEKAALETYDPATYEASELLSPPLLPADTKTEKEETPAYPLTDAQLSLEHPIGDAYPDRDYGFQLEPPAAGEEIAVLHTDKGDLRIRLFPEAAPETVANFKAMVTDGFYDGLTFCYTVEDFLIQTGDPDGDGRGGESSTGDYLPDEFDKKLLNLRGAVSMGNIGVQNTATCQFFINQTTPESGTTGKDYWKQNEEQFDTVYDYTVQQYTSYYEENETALAPFYGSQEIYLAANTTLAPKVNWVPEAVWDLYETCGGNIHLDGQWRKYGGNTVFGQVFDGMEAVDAIAASETDENDRPLTDVTIIQAEIVTYQGE